MHPGEFQNNNNVPLYDTKFNNNNNTKLYKGQVSSALDQGAQMPKTPTIFGGSGWLSGFYPSLSPLWISVRIPPQTRTLHVDWRGEEGGGDSTKGVLRKV